MIKLVLFLVLFLFFSCQHRALKSGTGIVDESKGNIAHQPIVELVRGEDYLIDRTPLRFNVELKKAGATNYILSLTITNTTKKDLLFNIPSDYFWGNYFFLRNVKTRVNAPRYLKILKPEDKKKHKRIRLVNIPSLSNSKVNFTKVEIKLSINEVVRQGKKVKVLNCGQLEFMVDEKDMYEFQVIYIGAVDAQMQLQQLHKHKNKTIWLGQAVSNRVIFKF